MPDQVTMDMFRPIWEERDRKYAAEEAARVAQDEKVRAAVLQGIINAQAVEDQIERESLTTFISVEDTAIRSVDNSPMESRENGQISERDKRRKANRDYLRSVLNK